MPLSLTDGARLMRQRGAEGRGEEQRGEERGEEGGGGDDAAIVRLMSEPVVRNETGKKLYVLDFVYLLLYFLSFAFCICIC